MIMSALPAPSPRRPIHQRRISFDGFRRDDGLWDIDCTLTDVKGIPAPLHERGVVPPGEPIHEMRVRLTLDDGFTIRDAHAAMTYVPFGECHRAAEAPLRALVGLTIGRGWRKAINEAMGGTAGCTHLRELVFNAATAAFQMIPHYHDSEAGTRRPSHPIGSTPPFYMGQCMSWAFDGPVVARVAPQFAQAASESK